MGSPFIITLAEQQMLDQIKADGTSINLNGLAVDVDGSGIGEVPYCTDLPVPIKNYATIVPAGSAIEKKVWDGMRVAAAPVLRQTSPFGFGKSVLGISPTVTIGTSPTTFLTYSTAPNERIWVHRPAALILNFSGTSTNNNVAFNFWVEINGVPSYQFRFFFDQLGHHESIGGNWFINIPSGPVTLNFKGQTNTSTVVIDGNDAAAFSVIG